MRWAAAGAAALCCAGGALGAVRLAQEERALSLADAFLNKSVGGAKRNRALSLRLLFHDVHQSRGGNGCVDLSDSDNGGLGDILGVMEPGNDINALHAQLVSEFGADAMSRADVWALVATAAAATVGSGMRAPFSLAQAGARPLFYGRVDLADCADEATSMGGELHALPLARLGFAEVDAQLGKEGLGLARDEFTALIAGAHSFGGSAMNNSGYMGVWVDATLAGTANLSAGASSDRLERDYLRILTSVPMHQVGLDSGKFQWAPLGRDAGVKSVFMLNTDMALLYDIKLSDESGESSTCASNASECGPSPTFEIVQAFLADDGTSFAEAFQRGFLKLSRFGYDSLRPAETPTQQPSLPPSNTPSQAPSVTAKPSSSAPTVKSSKAPTTPAPTQLPTTRYPTAFPTTKAPSTRPTKQPSSAPTVKSSKAPTTPAPTQLPTTRYPTAFPTTKASAPLPTTSSPSTTGRPTTVADAKAIAVCQTAKRVGSAAACADKSGAKLCAFNYEVLPGLLVDPGLPANTCVPKTFMHDAAVINADAYRRCVVRAVVASAAACKRTRGCFWNILAPNKPILAGLPVQCLPIWMAG
jgi:hypothetical protein